MNSTHHSLAERIVRLAQPPQAASPPQQRLLIALAGPPGSGKSTVALAVAALLTTQHHLKTAVVSIDGFHLSLAHLRGLPNADEALARRGAPWTFDAWGAVKLVRELRNSCALGLVDERKDIPVPTFDHAVKDPVAGGFVVKADVQVCILEGNYLLCDDGPWTEIAALVDERWLIEVRPELAMERLAARHLAAGIEDSMEKARRRAAENDVPNGEWVVEKSRGRYDVLVESVEVEREGGDAV